MATKCLALGGETRDAGGKASAATGRAKGLCSTSERAKEMKDGAEMDGDERARERSEKRPSDTRAAKGKGPSLYGLKTCAFIRF